MFDQAHENAMPTDSSDAGELTIGALTLRSGERTVYCRGRVAQLSPKEVALLELLMAHRGRVYTRAALFEQLYGSGSERSDKVIEVVMSTLRTKLAQLGADELIETRRGYGYVVPLN
ncbi:MAG: response regulator transcription factor [Lysobacterales bacterium]